MTRAAKKRRGRPKGSRNKPISLNIKQYSGLFSKADAKISSVLRIRLPNDYKVATEPPSYLSRLEAATVKYETAINDAISALKGD